MQETIRRLPGAAIAATLWAPLTASAIYGFNVLGRFAAGIVDDLPLITIACWIIGLIIFAWPFRSLNYSPFGRAMMDPSKTVYEKLTLVITDRFGIIRLVYLIAFLLMAAAQLPPVSYWIALAIYVAVYALLVVIP
jgi:hypothetical protein